jgi:hypothetical protein
MSAFADLSGLALLIPSANQAVSTPLIVPTTSSLITTGKIQLIGKSPEKFYTPQQSPWMKSMPSTADNQSQRKANNELPSQQRVQNQPGVSYITLRQNQVIEMTAGKKFEARSSAPEWPTPSQEMQKRWIERHPTYNTFSSRYMVSQKRLLFLGVPSCCCHYWFSTSVLSNASFELVASEDELRARWE